MTKSTTEFSRRVFLGATAASLLALASPSFAADVTIPIIVKDTTSFYWQIVLAGARAAGKDLGVNVPELGAQSESDIAGQISILENAVAGSPAAVVIAPTEFKALGKPIDAAAKSVPIIGIDSGADSKAFTSFLTTDNVQGGRIAAEGLAEAIKKMNGKAEGKIAIITSLPGVGSLDQRHEGFVEVIKAKYPGLEIVADKFADGQATTGLNMMTDLITANPDLVGVVVAWLMQAGVPMWLAILLTLLLGMAIGAFHAFGIVRMGLPPFIITLATLTALRGIGLLITNGSTINITNDDFTSFSLADFAGLPSLFWMVIAVSIPGYILLHHSRWGRYLFAVGSNREAARLSGVNVDRMIYLAYILSSTFAAFVGVLLASRIGIGNATQAEGWELQAIASSVIGGTSLFGAVGTVHGPLLGAFILATINNGANLLNLNSFWQRIITGALIILIVFFDQLRRRRG